VTGTAQTFIDNVTFYPAAGSPQDLDLKGYHIYCDNSLLTPSPVKDLEYVELPSGNNNYAVSAVYATGESRAVKAIEGVQDALSMTIPTPQSGTPSKQHCGIPKKIL